MQAWRQDAHAERWLMGIECVTGVMIFGRLGLIPALVPWLVFRTLKPR